MDKSIEHAKLAEIMWTAKHGKDKHYRSMMNRFLTWMWDWE